MWLDSNPLMGNELTNIWCQLSFIMNNHSIGNASMTYIVYKCTCSNTSKILMLWIIISAPIHFFIFITKDNIFGNQCSIHCNLFSLSNKTNFELYLRKVSNMVYQFWPTWDRSRCHTYMVYNGVKCKVW